jgi:hypothetical protein
VARNNDGFNGTTVNPACPLHSRAAAGGGTNGASADGAPAGKVEWAGLPVNLDLAFSQNQRDKVYAQHLRLRRGTRLTPESRETSEISPESSEPCNCGTADYTDLNADARRSVFGW